MNSVKALTRSTTGEFLVKYDTIPGAGTFMRKHTDFSKKEAGDDSPASFYCSYIGSAMYSTGTVSVHHTPLSDTPNR